MVASFVAANKAAACPGQWQISQLAQKLITTAQAPRNALDFGHPPLNLTPSFAIRGNRGLGRTIGLFAAPFIFGANPCRDIKSVPDVHDV
jgi:hypothetical protein